MVSEADMALIERAQAVLALDPLPEDAAEQLAAIDAQIGTDAGRGRMGDLWEALIAAGGADPD